MSLENENASGLLFRPSDSNHWRGIWIEAWVFCLLILVCSGCAFDGFRAKDRWADMADIITISGGLGLGAKARVGPLHAGAFMNHDCTGLRGALLGGNWGHAILIVSR